jgi:hypothetical protein
VKPGSILLRRWRYLFAVFVLISFFNTDLGVSASSWAYQDQSRWGMQRFAPRSL